MSNSIKDSKRAKRAKYGVKTGKNVTEHTAPTKAKAATKTLDGAVQKKKGAKIPEEGGAKPEKDPT